MWTPIMAVWLALVPNVLQMAPIGDLVVHGALRVADGALRGDLVGTLLLRQGVWGLGFERRGTLAEVYIQTQAVVNEPVGVGPPRDGW